MTIETGWEKTFFPSCLFACNIKYFNIVVNCDVFAAVTGDVIKK